MIHNAVEYTHQHNQNGTDCEWGRGGQRGGREMETEVVMGGDGEEVFSLQRAKINRKKEKNEGVLRKKVGS